MPGLLLILSLLQTINVTGSVSEQSGKPVSGATVVVGGAGVALETTSDKDGTFRFTLPKAGNYEFSADKPGLSGHPSTLFVGRDIDGVQIVLQSGPQTLTGSIKMEGGGPLPKLRPQIVIHYPSGSVMNRCEVTEQGLFFCPTPDEFKVSVENLPVGYVVRSMIIGALDLVKNPTTVTASNQPLVITLGVKIEQRFDWAPAHIRR